MTMLGKALEIGLLTTGTSVQEMIDHIGQQPIVFRGDNRDDYHKGMLTNDWRYIAMFHITEHRLNDRLSSVQCFALLDHIAKQVQHVIVRASKIKGAHSGIFANITASKPEYKIVRAYHCKFRREYQFVRYQGGITIIKVLTPSTEHFIGITADGRLYSATPQENK